MKSLKRQLEEATIQTHPQVNQAVMDELLGEFEQVKPLSSRSSRANDRRRIMLNVLVKPAVAAVVMVSVWLGLSMMGSQGVVWGQVVAQVEQAQACCFGLTTLVAGPDETGIEQAGQVQWMVYLSEQYGFRMDLVAEDSQDGTAMVSWYVPVTQDRLTMVMPNDRQWIELPYSPQQAQQERLQHPQRDPAETIRHFLASDYTELGQQRLNGVLVEGIEVLDPPTEGEALENSVGRLWVDVDTQLPVLIEIEGQARDHQVQWRLDFQWNEAIDPAVFSPDLEGYTLVQ